MTKGNLTIVGLGPGKDGYLSFEAMAALKTADFVILRTKVHPTVAFLDEQKVKYVTCDHFYEENADFEQVYSSIVEYVLQEAQTKKVTYAVPGSPLVAEKTVTLLRSQTQGLPLDFAILPAMSFLDLIYTKVGVDPIEGIRIIDAADKAAVADAGKYPLIITQVYSQLVASELKMDLMEVLPDETKIYFMRNLSLPDEEFLTIPLFELDRQKNIDHLTTVFVPVRRQTGEMDIRPLERVVETLRAPGGCPWDRVQNHSSLRKGLVEEVYELLEAIDDRDAKGMKEELGDVLLQVVFHAKLAEEEGLFTMQEVIEEIVAKLVHRHPHVYGTIHVDGTEEVLRNWDALKAEEKTERKSVLDGVAKGLPALMRAYKLQVKAAKVGFDWQNKEEVWQKVEEESQELQEAIVEGNSQHIEAELGDVFFALANYAKHLGLEPETALNGANNRFVKRFSYVEAGVKATGRPWAAFSLKELDKLWQDAKKVEKK